MSQWKQCNEVIGPHEQQVDIEANPPVYRHRLTPKLPRHSRSLIGFYQGAIENEGWIEGPAP